MYRENNLKYYNKYEFLNELMVENFNCILINDLNIQVQEVDEYDEVKTIDEFSIDYTSDQQLTIKASNLRSLYYASNYIKENLETNFNKKLKSSLLVRSYLLDISRGKIPKENFIRNLLFYLSSQRINQVYFYIEPNSIVDGEVWLAGFEKILIRKIIEFASKFAIEIIPAVSSFSHLYDLTTKYKEIQDTTAVKYLNREFYFLDRLNHYTLDPLNDNSWKYTKAILDFATENFKSKIINIGCDEPYDLYTKEFIRKVKFADIGEIYFNYVNKIINYILEKNKEPMIWGHAIVDNEDNYFILEKLDKKVKIANCNYHSYPELKQFELVDRNGFEQILCGSDLTFENIFSSYSNASLNILSLYNLSKRLSFCKGLMVTHWGDFGHINSIIQGLLVVKKFNLLAFNQERPKINDESWLIYLSLCHDEVIPYSEIIRWWEEEKLEPEYTINKEKRTKLFKELSSYDSAQSISENSDKVDWLIKNKYKINWLPKYFVGVLLEELDIYKEFLYLNNILILKIKKHYYSLKHVIEETDFINLRKMVNDTFDKFESKLDNYYNCGELGNLRWAYLKLINTIEKIG
ncbi:hypothetical protein SHELI_v1c05110 [Spiroplasma helicoides]|uniref:Glycoside hydrolase family 20 catalytic domain-containing protein n=1 Tax=Spiroplasma helicoides TaxID=216938 RepID=A0A1B3SKJ7_9MOLU|nr:family 20 glycosylhydrolase [Spiroplasma helicoides]AOG60462.1 hypothetical protein SHELI_v1c05110 [Spiroplasma helicoides]